MPNFRGVYFVLEQRSTSWMLKMLAVFAAFQRMGMPFVPRVTTWMRAFGHEMPKCTHLVGTLPTLHEMRRTFNTRTARRVTRNALWERTAAGTQGGKDLASSAECTVLFWESLFAAWQRAN